ncbi:heterokaryon incompatibility protein-domain-containing protein [Xylaria digitata]|nr:heterokaryon incompatibility protein-domain-containing protein [Xylaria digitata]
MSQTREVDDCVRKGEVVPQHRISSCSTCRLIRVRDTSRATTYERPSETYGHGIENGGMIDDRLGGSVAEYDSESDSEPFEFYSKRNPTYSYQATLDFFHGAQSTRSDESVTLCSLCDHWVNGLLTREWGENEIIARVCLGTFPEIESRSECFGCRGLCQIISKHSFRPDNTQVLALELFKNLQVSSYGGHYRGFPTFEVLEEAVLAQQSVNWERLIHLCNDGKSEDKITTTMNTFTEFQRPGRFLEADVPLLFRDAFKVCSQLGVDYLWVDRICIIQDDSSTKSIQLEAMGRIYSMASFTIVSREPASVRQGLHGVSQPRIPQLNIPLGDMLLVPSGGRISMLDSTWFTRGWTYQEGALSKKVLIFGEDMVYTACCEHPDWSTEGFRAS